MVQRDELGKMKKIVKIRKTEVYSHPKVKNKIGDFFQILMIIKALILICFRVKGRLVIVNLATMLCQIHYLVQSRI